MTICNTGNRHLVRVCAVYNNRNALGFRRISESSKANQTYEHKKTYTTDCFTHFKQPPINA